MTLKFLPKIFLLISIALFCVCLYSYSQAEASVLKADSTVVFSTAIETKEPVLEVAPPTPAMAVHKSDKTKIIPPLAMALTAIVSMGISASMSVFATALVVNGATPFVPSIARLLFIIPFGFLKRNRQKWGKVLARTNHEPLKMIPLELIVIEEDGYEQVVGKTYSDENGDYGFGAKAGRYKIRPAVLEAKIITLNGDFHKEGDLIEVKSDGATPSVNPLLLSSPRKAELSRAIYFSFFKSFQTTFFILGIIATSIGSLLALYALFARPSTISLLIFFLYLVLWVVTIAKWTNKRFSGRVIDTHTRLPIAFAVIRIMSNNGTRFVKGAITNEKGDFTTLLKHGRYMILSGKEGYRIIRPKIFSTKMHSIGLIEMLPE